MPLQTVDIVDLEFAPKMQLNYFCPKRFNRYPRFQATMKNSESNPHIQERTICLSSEILGLNPNASSDIEKKTFDPFEKVVLVGSIDNQILTSFRTLQGNNNSVSDTQKIVHQRFLGDTAPQSRFYKSFAQQICQKHNYEPIDEDKLELLSDSLRQQTHS